MNALVHAFATPSFVGRMTHSAEDFASADWLRAIAQSRDRKAFERLFAHFAPRMKAYFKRSGFSAELAEDLAQDVLMAIWHKAAQYDPSRADASAWVFGIARNLKIDTMRRRRVATPRQDAGDLSDPPALADMILATKQSAEHLRRALRDLPPEQSEVVALAFFDERSHGEIEATLGVPLGTVKSRLRLAMTKLRANLRGCS